MIVKKPEIVENLTGKLRNARPLLSNFNVAGNLFGGVSDQDRELRRRAVEVLSKADFTANVIASYIETLKKEGKSTDVDSEKLLDLVERINKTLAKFYDPKEKVTSEEIKDVLTDLKVVLATLPEDFKETNVNIANLLKDVAEKLIIDIPIETKKSYLEAVEQLVKTSQTISKEQKAEILKLILEISSSKKVTQEEFNNLSKKLERLVEEQEVTTHVDLDEIVRKNGEIATTLEEFEEDLSKRAGKFEKLEEAIVERAENISTITSDLTQTFTKSFLHSLFGPIGLVADEILDISGLIDKQVKSVASSLFKGTKNLFSQVTSSLFKEGHTKVSEEENIAQISSDENRKIASLVESVREENKEYQRTSVNILKALERLEKKDTQLDKQQVELEKRDVKLAEKDLKLERKQLALEKKDVKLEKKDLKTAEKDLKLEKKQFNIEKKLLKLEKKEKKLLEGIEDKVSSGGFLDDLFGGFGGRVVGKVLGRFGKFGGILGGLGVKTIRRVGEIGGTLLRGLGSVGKFGGRILGKAALPLTAALSIFDFGKGYTHASEVTGKKEEELTFANKLGAGLSSAVSGLTLGLLGEKTVYKGLARTKDFIKNIFGFGKENISQPISANNITSNLTNLTKSLTRYSTNFTTPKLPVEQKAEIEMNIPKIKEIAKTRKETVTRMEKTALSVSNLTGTPAHVPPTTKPIIKPPIRNEFSLGSADSFTPFHLTDLGLILVNSGVL